MVVDIRYTGAGSRADLAKNNSGKNVEITDTDTVTVENSAGSVSDTGTVTVASGVISKVALPATTALVKNGDTKTGVTGTGTTATITVAAGVISAIALS